MKRWIHAKSDNKPTCDKALEAYQKLAYYNYTSHEVSRLLRKICRECGVEYDSGDIYQTLCNLTNSGRRKFLQGCKAIEDNLSDRRKAKIDEFMEYDED